LIYLNPRTILGTKDFRRTFGFGGVMRKLVLILIAFIAVVTFIRAFDNGKIEGSDISDISISVSENISEK
jgi:hypothetical protein